MLRLTGEFTRNLTTHNLSSFSGPHVVRLQTPGENDAKQKVPLHTPFVFEN